MKEPLFRQCELRHDTRRTVAWIPSTLARQDAYLTINDENGWQVVSLGALVSAAFLKARQYDHRRQRIASDI